MADAETTSVNFSSAYEHALAPVTTGFAATATAGTLVAEAVTTGGEGKDDAVEEVVIAAEADGATAGDEAGVSNGAGADATAAVAGVTDLATTAGAASPFVSATLGCEVNVNAPRQFKTNNTTAASKNNKAPKD